LDAADVSDVFGIDIDIDAGKLGPASGDGQEAEQTAASPKRTTRKRTPKTVVKKKPAKKRTKRSEELVSQ
jgi:hypothetical protein